MGRPILQKPQYYFIIKKPDLKKIGAKGNDRRKANGRESDK